MKQEPKIKPRIMLGVLLHGVPQDVYLLNSFTALSGRLDYYSSAAGAKEGWSVQRVLVTAPTRVRFNKKITVGDIKRTKILSKKFGKFGWRKRHAK